MSQTGCACKDKAGVDAMQGCSCKCKSGKGKMGGVGADFVLKTWNIKLPDSLISSLINQGIVPSPSIPRDQASNEPPPDLLAGFIQGESGIPMRDPAITGMYKLGCVRMGQASISSLKTIANAISSFDVLPPGFEWFKGPFHAGCCLEAAHPYNIFNGQFWPKGEPEIGSQLIGVPGSKYDGYFFVWHRSGLSGRWVRSKGSSDIQPSPVAGDLPSSGCCHAYCKGNIYEDWPKSVSGVFDSSNIEYWIDENSLHATWRGVLRGQPLGLSVDVPWLPIKNWIEKHKKPLTVIYPKQGTSGIGFLSLFIDVAKEKAARDLAAKGVSKGLTEAHVTSRVKTKVREIVDKARSGVPSAVETVKDIDERAQRGEADAIRLAALMKDLDKAFVTSTVPGISGDEGGKKSQVQKLINKFSHSESYDELNDIALALERLGQAKLAQAARDKATQVLTQSLSGVGSFWSAFSQTMKGKRAQEIYKGTGKVVAKQVISAVPGGSAALAVSKVIPGVPKL